MSTYLSISQLSGDGEIKRNVAVLMGEEDPRNSVVEFIGKSP